MTIGYDINGTTPANGASAMLRFQQGLTTAAWVCESSGTGSSGAGSGVYNSSGNSCTTAALIANPAAWTRWRSGDGLREMTIQCSGTIGTGDWKYRWKYSAPSSTGTLVGFTGGAPAAGVTPTATNEEIRYGGGTDASPTYAAVFNAMNGTYRLWIVCFDSGLNYSWTMFTSISSTGVQAGWTYMDVCATGTYPTQDTDPSVFYAGVPGTTVAN